MNKSISVLINSCDAYSDVWPLLFHLFRKYWPDCPYSVYLGSNLITYPHPGVTTLLTGEHVSWSTSTRFAVERIDTPQILMVDADALLVRPVDSKLVKDCSRLLDQLSAGYLRLRPSPPPDRSLVGVRLVGEIDRSAAFRCSLHPAIWRRDVLIALLRDGETAWGMEILGTQRSRDLSTAFLCTWKDSFPCARYGINHGAWHPSTVKLARREAIQIDLSRRPVLGLTESARIATVTQLYFLNRVLPKSLLLTGQRVLRRLGLARPERRLLESPTI